MCVTNDSFAIVIRGRLLVLCRFKLFRGCRTTGTAAEPRSASIILGV